MRGTWIILLAIAATGLSTTSSYAFGKRYQPVYQYSYPASQMVLAPSATVGSQGLVDLLPFIQLGAQIGMRLLESRLQPPLPGQQPATPPGLAVHVNAADVKRVEESLTSLDDILKRSREINPKVTPLPASSGIQVLPQPGN